MAELTSRQKSLLKLYPQGQKKILNDIKDDTVEALKRSTLPVPQMAKHVQGGRPLSEPMLTPHSPQTNNGYARNSFGGFFTT
eukprot:CAMPEP_0172151870 /NCGR_PEP_ID=MMETSP1050-20130122/496_1 /TAXON_ID=233186 /ORGANISM="Cryptomonas curvata, Strain CCAP979/52" /LENGTH=81 /DNA_ID=CAMNT_0012820077 /DNA_START=33 /DNA_END=278 /DNA_ORIENTATION=-